MLVLAPPMTHEELGEGPGEDDSTGVCHLLAGDQFLCDEVDGLGVRALDLPNALDSPCSAGCGRARCPKCVRAVSAAVTDAHCRSSYTPRTNQPSPRRTDHAHHRSRRSDVL